MAFEYLGYQFDGAYTSPDSLESGPGVYVIWCRRDQNWAVLDVGEADDVKERVKNHDRADCWKQNCVGIIYYSATYTPSLNQSQRNEIEQKIRDKANPLCGKR